MDETQEKNAAGPSKQMPITHERRKNLELDYSTPCGTDFPPLQLKQTDVRVEEGNNAIIEWEFSSEERSPIFEIAWWTDETDRRSDQTSSTNYRITKLKYGAKYSVNVTLVSSNAGGVSRASNTVYFDTAPRAPYNLKVFNYQPSREDSIVVSFDNDNEKGVKHVVSVEPLGNEAKSITVETENGKVMIPDLIAGETYRVSVVTKYTKIDGEELQSKRVTYEQLVVTFPPIPEEVRVRFDDDRLVLEWQQPKVRPDGYDVHWTVNGEKHVSDVREKSFSVGTFAASTTYRFKVAAVNSAGRGDFSKEEKYTTAPAAPTNVCVRKSPVSPDRSFIVTFEEPDPVAKFYEVVAVTMAGKSVALAETTSNTAVLSSLEPGSMYRVHVTAVTEGGRSQKAYCVDQK